MLEQQKQQQEALDKKSNAHDEAIITLKNFATEMQNQQAAMMQDFQTQQQQITGWFQSVQEQFTKKLSEFDASLKDKKFKQDADDDM